MKVLIVPNMVSDQVVRDYKRILQIPLSDPRMDDQRRVIHEEDNEAENTSSQAFLMKIAGLPLGNHFHLKKVEVWFIVEGELERFITADPAGNNKEEHEHVPAGSMIVIPPEVTHTFFFAAGSRMLVYSSERFDPEDMTVTKLA